MLLETLQHEDLSFNVSISELKNENELGQDELLSIAKRLSKNIHVFQLLDASLIAGTGHLLSAAQNALNAFQGAYAIARSIDVEILLYSSCQYQIGNALETLGVKDGLNLVALVVVDSNKELVLDRTNTAIDEIGHEVSPPFAASEERIARIMEHFDIKQDEISAIAVSDALSHRYDALSRSVASRVSLVSLDA